VQKFEASYFSGKNQYVCFLGWAPQLEVPESELSKEIRSNRNISGNVPKFLNSFRHSTIDRSSFSVVV
jgi:hypothetical protein